MPESIARALNLRQDEGRTLLVMGSFLLLNTANTTVLSAAKNGLFLSVYPGELIPHAVIGAALLTALFAIVFTGYVAGTARRSLALGLTVALALSVVACRVLFALDARTAFIVYLWLSTVQVLVLTHAWDYAGDLLTGRQAKRLLPLIGVGASLGAIVGGAGVAPAALGLGTDNLLWISVTLLVAALPLLWLIPEPVREREEGVVDLGAARQFIRRASTGVRSVASNRLLRLLAVGLVALTLTGTLIDLQLKFLLQETYTRDRITVIYGLLSALVGAGTLVLQLWASRVLFPKYGVSFAAVLHGGLLALAAGGVAVFGGLGMLVAAQALDDILQFSLQKPVEQVSLLPFPGGVKSVALATLGGVLRPLSKASAGGIALGLASRPELLPLATVAAGVTAAVTYTRHRSRYLHALQGALTRQAADFTSPDNVPLVADAGALSVLDRALQDPDPTVAVFATSLLEQLPSEEALPRILALLGHDVSEVRAEAGRVLRRIDTPLDFGCGVAVASQLGVEEEPLVIAQLLETIGAVGGVEPATVEDYASDPDAEIRKAALVALGRLGWEGTEERLRSMLESADSRQRAVAAEAVGELGAARLLDSLASVVSDDAARPAALGALASLGRPAVPVMAELLERRELPLPLRRSVVTAMAGVEGDEARNALLALLDEPVLGPAALTSLTRMRTAGSIGAVEPRGLRSAVDAQIRTGLRYAAVADELRRDGRRASESFTAQELEALQHRSVERVLKLLGLSYDTARLSTIAVALYSPVPADRSNALELLEGIMPRADALRVMPFLETVAEGFPRWRVNDLLDDPTSIRADPAESLVDDVDWWPRALGLHLLDRDDEVTTPGTSPHPSEDDPMIPLIEKVMILKGSEFFRNFPGSDLAGIAAHADVSYAEPEEVIFEQGAEGDAFYVIVHGAVEISRGRTQLAILGPREGFGEMALLDRESRSATATAKEETTLLRLDRDSFDRVVEQNPVIARGIYRVLTERLRNTLAQVAAG